MSNQDNLAQVLSAINNAEKASKTEVVIRPASKFILAVINFIKKEDYIKDFKVNENKQGGTVTIQLNGTINKVGAIKPRFKVKASEIEKFEQRYLPAKGFGLLVISTSKGLLTNKDAAEKKIGGRLIAYCY